jgi:hypothetical protein
MSTNSLCPVISLLNTILDEVRSLKSEGPKKKKSLKVTTPRPHVNGLVIALQLKYPEKIWTADAFAKKIGCTSAAVRQTKAWKAYRVLLESEKQKRQQQRGHRYEKSSLETIDSDESDKNDDFDDI